MKQKGSICKESIIRGQNNITSKRTVILPYAGEKGFLFLMSLVKQLKQLLPNKVNQNIAFTGKKFSFNFNVKHPVPFTEKHDVI